MTPTNRRHGRLGLGVEWIAIYGDRRSYIPFPNTIFQLDWLEEPYQEVLRRQSVNKALPI